MPAGEPVPLFQADHPFIFLIQDDETGTILFMGWVGYRTIGQEGHRRLNR
jgi:serine protease inhibitor